MTSRLVPIWSGTVHEEYRRHTATFPYALPRGYRFPSRPEWPDEAGGYYEALFHVYHDWRRATATAAYSAYLRDDCSRAEALLARIESTYSDELRRVIIDDPENGYLRDAIWPAYNGDYTMLKFQDIDPYLRDLERLQIVRDAGEI